MIHQFFNFQNDFFLKIKILNDFKDYQKINMKNLIFYVTVPNFEEGKRLARILVESKAAACVNLIKDIFSIYHWKGKIEEANEGLLIIKTSEKKSEDLINIVNKNHSYELPECVGVKIEDGSKKYINWINEAISN